MNGHGPRSEARAGAGLLLVALLAAGCAATPEARPGHPVLEGRVTRDGHGTPDAFVELLPLEFQLDPGAPPVARARAAADGTFRLTAPAGSYLALARAPGQFGYFGRNPVRLSTRLSGLHIPLVDEHPLRRTAVAAGAEQLSGRILFQGEPVSGARVFVYLEASRGLRGPGFAVSDASGPDGRYQVPVPPGTYFVAARLRPGGWRVGSLEPGDLFGVLASFPLVVAEGEAVEADLSLVEVPSRAQMARFQGRFTRVAGRIVGSDGQPAAGMRACLWAAPEMLDRPLAVSEPTGADGTFTIESPLLGPHFLGAREILGAPPTPGERVGFYRGPQGARVELRPDTPLLGLTVVTQVVP